MTSQYKKVALVHDTLSVFGGAERVLAAFSELFPQADIYTSFYNPRLDALLNTRRKPFCLPKHYQIFQRWPELFKPYLFFYWEQLDFSQYDLVITSSHSFSSKAVITHPHTLHVSYIHTPPRYLYTEENQYSFFKRRLWRTVVTLPFQSLRKKDFIAAQRPDLIIANSDEVRRRIKKYYHRESTVIYPPIPFPDTMPTEKRVKKYFLFHSRLVKQKGLELVIQTCNRYHLPLLVVGTGPQKQHFQRLAGKTIQFLDFVPDKKMPNIYRHAIALLYASRNEDFGMVPIEAIAHGVPVVAYYSGGVKETVIPAVNGYFFYEYTEQSLWQAIKMTQKQEWRVKELCNSITKFSEKNFQKKLWQLLESKTATSHAQ